MSSSWARFQTTRPKRSIRAGGRRRVLIFGLFPSRPRNPQVSRRNMILKQFYLPCLAHASYVIGDEETGTAVVVDPQRDTDQYITFAAEHGLGIKYVFLTHLHADFVAGHLELRDRVGARIYLGAAAKAGYAFTPLRDADGLKF